MISREVVRLYLVQLNRLEQELGQTPGIVVADASAPPRLTLDTVVSDPELNKKVCRLFNQGHYAEAVERAYKYLDNLVKKQSGIRGSSGASLMRSVFSPKKPILKLNELQTTSESDEQQGYMDILAGVMTGIRNPRAHEDEWEDDEFYALQLLSLANHLVERVKRAKKVEKASLDKNTNA